MPDSSRTGSPIRGSFHVLLQIGLSCFLLFSCILCNRACTSSGRTPEQATATSVSGKSTYLQATSGTPILSDPLTGNDGNQWDEGLCSFVSNTYQVSADSTQSPVFCLARATSFTNFTVQVQITMLDGQWGGLAGLIIRAKDSKSTTSFYAFGIDEGENYGFGLYKANPGWASFSMNATDQGGANASDALKTGLGQTNLLTIIASQSSFILFINGTYIDTVNDNTLRSGSIGFFAEVSPSQPTSGLPTYPTSAAFGQLQVWAHL